MTWVLIIGLLMNAVALPLAARRVLFLYRVISSGQPAPDRIRGVTGRLGAAVRRQLVEVLGQRKMLKWSVPGTAHFFVMWAFFILGSVYVEAYGSLLQLFSGTDRLDWAIPLVGDWSVLGFVQDFIAVMAFAGIVTFVVIRVRNAPKDLGRRSRFFGSHLSGAWITLFMIFNVIWTMFLFRGASSALGNLPYDGGAFVSIGLGNLLDGLDHGALEVVEGIGLLLHIGVMLAFLIFVLNSKHLHIFLAPLNILFGREPVALGAAKPLMSAGQPLTLDDLEDLDEDAKLGVGAAEDFSWKGILDFATCTECGRCQDQCPAWNTEKPLSPKLMIMALRDHTLAKAPYLLADEGQRDALAEGNATLTKEVERPLVGDTGDEWFYMPEDGSGVIDPDVLWSCVTCGACVEQCPVDIEHVDHIIDMRRHQVLVESNFPAELNQLFKGMESKGNPWNLSPNMRMDWAQGLDFEVPVVGEDLESLESVDWLFWVGCAGAYEDRAKKTTRAVAELLNIAGISFGVLGKGETCTGDSARRAGNEFVFQGLAQQNVETFQEFKVKKVVSTCAHCFNTLKNEYKEFGIELEVVHHTQLLNRLVREGRLTPVTDGAGAAKRSITYHDPCYIGRHNQVYEPPRELLQVLPGAEFVEMERNSERSFCCGAGGARMWMEETIGERINLNRTTEAVGTGADQIAVGCPFCRVMLSDGLTALQDSGGAREEVEVLDVAQMLLASVKGEPATRQKKAAASSASAAADAGAGGGTATLTRDEETAAEPEPGDATQTEGTITETADAGPAAKASGGSSLFDLGGDEPAEPEKSVPDEPAEPASGGSLFDLGGDEAPEPNKSVPDEPAEPASGGSLFDLGEPDTQVAEEEPASSTSEVDEEPPPSTPVVEDEPTPSTPVVEEGRQARLETTTEDTPPPAPTSKIPEGGSLFDITTPADPEPAAKEPAPSTPKAEDEPTPSTPRAEDEPAPSTPVVEEGRQARLETTTEDTATTAPPTNIPEGGSLFDIAAPAEAATPAVAEQASTGEQKAEAEGQGEAEAAQEARPSGTSDRPDPAAVSAAATAAASEGADITAEPTVTTEPEDDAADRADSEAEDEDEDEPEPKPAVPSGGSHQPKTDVDINEGGSLFDL